MNTRHLLLVAASLLLAGCGQVTDHQSSVPQEAVTPTTEVPVGAKTFSEVLREPGWTQTSEGFWERETENGHESIYVGVEGAKQALKQREAIQAKMLANAPAEQKTEMLERFKAQNLSLQNVINSPEQKTISTQSIFQCTFSQSVQRLTAQPGIKATAWINCPESGYSPNAGAQVQSNQGSNYGWPNRQPTSATASTSIPGASGCSGYAFSEATASSGAHVGDQKSGSGC